MYPFSGVNHNLVRIPVYRRDTSGDVMLPVNGLARHNLRQPAYVPAAVVQVAQWAIQPRRRHLQRVRVVERDVSVEHRAQISADAPAIIEADRLAIRVSGDLLIFLLPVEEHTKHPPD